MLLTEFPDLSWLRQQIRKDFQDQRSWDGRPLPEKGWPSVILNVCTAQTERREIKGPFSIFMNLKGKSTIGRDNRQIQLGDNAFVLSNYGQTYDLLVHESQPTECFNVHFGSRFYFDALKTIGSTNDNLLDDPFEPSSSGASFHFQSHYRTPEFNRLVQQLLQEYSTQNQEIGVQEEALFELFTCIISQNQQEILRSENLVSLQASTREEIMARLFRAVDFIYANLESSLGLDQLASVACLSKFHFLRSFKAAFEASPHQFIKNLRIQKAIGLLKTTSFSLPEIAEKVGLENGSSLSRMIHQKTGLRPTMIRS